MHKIIVTISALILAISCTPTQKSLPKYGDLEKLRDYTTGSFSSLAQAEADTNFFDISLEMAPIWQERTDGYWFYVEQAVADHKDKPYRQRIYHIYRPTDSTFISDVYTLNQVERFVGAFSDARKFATLAPDSLTLREGCAIHLAKTDDTTFVGSTKGKGCLSALRGAEYATSEVRITPGMLFSWDRGYDSAGNQVWGARTGGYRFLRAVSTDE